MPFLAVVVLLLACVAYCAGARDVCDGYYSQSGCSPPSSVPLFADHLPGSLRGSSLLDGTRLPACGAYVNGSQAKSRFIVLGDFGLQGNCAAQVALLTQKIEAQFGSADFVFNTGDNNYWDGGCGSFEANVGQYFSRFFPHGSRCIDPDDYNAHTLRNIMAEARNQYAHQQKDAASGSRFFPTLGNHDWDKYRVLTLPCVL